MTKELPWTGERLVRTCGLPLVYEHVHRYGLAVAIAANKRVLDIACGEGYGSSLLSRVATSVTGVDLDGGTIAHAKTRYRHRNLRFIQGACESIPLPDQSVDLVVSFETIEHIADHVAFISEIRRVLVTGGLLLISSPNRDEYQKVAAQPNPYHRAELSHAEFVSMIRKRFKQCVFAQQRLVAGSWIGADRPSAKTKTVTISGSLDDVHVRPGVSQAIYSIAYASDKPLPQVPVGVFDNHDESAHVWNLLEKHGSAVGAAIAVERAAHDTGASAGEIGRLTTILQEREKHIALLQEETRLKTGQVRHFQEDAEERARHVAILQQENETKTEQVRHFQNVAEERLKHIDLLQQENETKTKQVFHFKHELEAQAQRLAVRQRELQEQNERQLQQLGAAAAEVDQLRSELLLLQDALSRSDANADALTQCAAELQAEVESFTSQRDLLRTMLVAVQRDLHATLNERDLRQRELRDAERRLRAQRKEVDRFARNVAGKLILPFGRSQRKVQQFIRDARRGH